MFDVNKIKEDAYQNFEKAWVESVSLIPRDTVVEISGKGKSHPFRDMVQKFRELLINEGLSEIENLTILPESDVYKEYGPEAPLILDRIFYLAKLPRPDIGVGKEQTAVIESIIGKFDTEKLQAMLRAYKKGEIESDDFIEAIVKAMGIRMEQATEMVEKVFPEFKDLKPQPTNLTLRSHMSGTWYHTLAAMQNKASFPLALFSVGYRFRNEQKEDEGHLRVHNSASIVLMDPNMSLEAGRLIVQRILNKFGFKNVRFETKKATSKYYAKDLEQEVFVEYKGKWVEIGDIGMYSVVSLANFGIKYPVFNAGFGIERMTMVIGGYTDVRELVFPQFSAKEFTDEEIANSVSFIEIPKTDRGKSIAAAIESCARIHKDDPSPTEVTAYEDDSVIVKLVEKENGKRLIGPAAFNRVYVKDSSIEGGVEVKGTDTNKTFIDAISKQIAYETEAKHEDTTIKKKIVKSLSNVNLAVPKEINMFITSKNKKIEIFGPVFIEAEVHFKQTG
jgi:O-phosphoseryl-tRNA synthetase